MKTQPAFGRQKKINKRPTAIKALLILNFVFIFSLNIKSQISPVKVALFYGHNIPSAVFTVESGSYLMKADGCTIIMLEEEDVAYFSVVDGKIWVQTIDKGFAGVYSNIELTATGSGGVFILKPVSPSMDPRVYDGELLLSVGFGALEIINRVDTDLYLAGVVEAEAGINGHIEFYKAQAVICRTFLYRQTEKHAGEGFNVCDAVYCQVYKGKSTGNRDILEAVRQTGGQVITGAGSRLVTAAFHANCGGQTADSEDVWLVYDPVLRSVTDPYCKGGNGFSWRREISLSDWKVYLKGEGMRTNNTPGEVSDLFVWDYQRNGHYSIGNTRVAYTKIRSDWNLRSSFFSILPGSSEETILLNGRGHGHGVGFCQEGAMEMARRGYIYTDIIGFYYKGVSLDKISDLPH